MDRAHASNFSLKQNSLHLKQSHCSWQVESSYDNKNANPKTKESVEDEG